jgi:hypothetical protein
MTTSSPEARGMFGSLIFALGGICLLIHLAGVGRLAYDVVVAGAATDLVVKAIVLGVAFVFGLGLGALSQRRFESPAFPLFARVFGWVYLALTWVTYLGITLLVNDQHYSLLQYGSFWLLLFLQLGAIIALRLVAPTRAIGLFAIPMLAVVLFHLLLVVYKVVFASVPISLYLLGDLGLILGMGFLSSTMLGEDAFRAVLDRVIEKTA